MGNTFFFSWEPAFMVWLQSHLGTFGLTLAKIFSLFGEDGVRRVYPGTYTVYADGHLPDEASCRLEITK